MAGPGKAVMADWLALHGLVEVDCLGLLLRHAALAAPSRAPDPIFHGPPPWPMVMNALNQALPQATEILTRISAKVRIDLAPDPQRFPRAFTLHDDGRGLPFISCPLRGRSSDLLVLAHELGHACQLLASSRPDQPPVMRETAAYLTENLVLVAICRADRERGAVLEDLHRAATEQIMWRDGRSLCHALEDLASPYSYSWNYPIARELATRAMRHLEPEAQWGVFTGEVALSELRTLPEA